MINHDSVAEFSWDYGSTFFLETEDGLFEWSDPSYGGNNIIRRSKWASLEERFNETTLFTRGKGTHIISEYCGPDVLIVSDENADGLVRRGKALAESHGYVIQDLDESDLPDDFWARKIVQSAYTLFCFENNTIDQTTQFIVDQRRILGSHIQAFVTSKN